MEDKNDTQNIIHRFTPPSTNRKIRNPFDKALIDKLHKPICSPGMCKIYKKKNSGTFRWDIDQTCTLVPADIVVCNSQFEPSPDPALEKIAEEATDRFFSQEMVMPSPLVESSKKVKPLLPSCDASIQIDSLIQEKIVVTKDVSAQTVLTLPPELPPEIELLLKPFYTYTQEQNMSGEYEITANGSLRRKLFFEEHSDMEHYDDSEHTDDEIQCEPRPPSSYEAHTPVVVSPDLSQDFVAKGMKRSFGTPLRKVSLNKDKPSYRNKILNVQDYGEPGFCSREFQTPRRNQKFSTMSPLASSSISPIVKAASSDEEGQDFPSKSTKHSFGTPLKEVSSSTEKPCYRNKLLNLGDRQPCFSSQDFRTPTREELNSITPSSLACASISPITKVASNYEKKTACTSPETETMATCLDCVESRTQSEKKCFCKLTENKIKRSVSLKESPPRSRKSSFSFSEKRSVSMSSLHRSRSVQKLDFSMDMSIDSSLHNQSQDLESCSPFAKVSTWSLVEEASIQHLLTDELKEKTTCNIQSSTQIHSAVNIDVTPKGKAKSNVRSHEISKIRVPHSVSPLHMSLDNSLDNSDNLPLSLEDKKVDFNRVDLKFLTDNISQFDYTANNTAKVGNDNSTSFKKADSGFNENTFYANASSYYESAIKPSELTVTNVSKSNNSKNALKEISNVHWMRLDSGFKDECSADATQFYPENDGLSSSKKRFTGFNFSEAKIDEKENMVSEEFLTQTNKNEAMSMSDIFTEELTFNCNFSSTPSKNKTRRVQS